MNNHHDHCYFARTTGKPQTDRTMGINIENKHESDLQDMHSTTFQNLFKCLINNYQNGLVHALFNDRSVKERLEKVIAEDGRFTVTFYQLSIKYGKFKITSNTII